MSFKKTSKMKKNAPHKQKDYPEGVQKTAARMVEDMVTDPTEPHQKAVKTQEAEVRDVQLREFCSFATRGGKHEEGGVLHQRGEGRDLHQREEG
jgi:hypothetical protein